MAKQLSGILSAAMIASTSKSSPLYLRELSLHVLTLDTISAYLWSLVFATDMFYTVFKQNPMDGLAGRRYRHTVLEKGGSQDEMGNLEEFLGRKPNTEAFYKELGLSN